MKVSFNDDNAKIIAQVEGRVDTTTANEFQNQILTALKNNPAELILDCSKLEYISSAGLRALLIIAKTAKISGVAISLTSLTVFVRDVLATSGFDTLFNVV